MGFTAAHGLLEVEDGLRGVAGQPGNTFGDQVLHTLGDVGFLEKGCAVSFACNQLIKLFNLITEFYGKSVRLKLAGVTNGFHITIIPKLRLICLLSC